MWKRVRSSLLLLTFTSLGLAANPAMALSQDALPDAVADASDAADAADVATSDAADAADASADATDAKSDAGTDTGIKPPDAAPDAATADAKTDAPRTTLPDDDGCGCRIGGSKPGSAGIFTMLGALAGVGLVVRRRRR